MDYDLVIIGAGPGGYVAAIRAGQTGLKTAVIEKTKVGGMCLNWGCIPTKALLESAKRLQAVKDAATFGVDGIEKKQLSFNWEKAVNRVDRIVKRLTKGVEFLLKKNGVKLITGKAAINADKSVSVENMLLSTKNIIIGTGSKPTKLAASIPADVLVEVEGLLNLKELPGNVVVLGNGPHAVELAQFFKLVDSKVMLVSQEETLIPDADPFISAYAEKMLKKSKVDVLMSAAIKRYENGELLLEVESGETEAKVEKTVKKVACDKLINASVRTAVVPESAVSLEMENGFLRVDDYLRTSEADIYAVGDVNGRSIFAHAASAQGLYVVNRINGIHQDSLFDVNRFPINIYTYPEIAQVGLTETQVSELNTGYKVSEFPLSANGKALTEGATEGLVRMLSDRKYGEVLGVQIIAPHATDMIAEASLIMQMEGTVHDVAQTVHAHPTISEVFMEAGFDAFDQAIHK
ncbi:MAG: dihydrolipoyl dehydrogenase [Candidatus Aminicenantes bacterium]|nr:dihydrolipoyl dehydrogenase [Candidatus Aminicenantes bacterium]NIM80861.1 dihydrolipoyl dehydrogenase [Candidatus Aminicenantes bacterium]NIN20245.1 dihydrolipoyl dehydrogenase [Candidatus Aminicenantes bacterium]NIN44024.1 dihydrolipoyl dehydrogenase [Candidatus Aminicenantes bacterium]NIN86834.1 dihydrolipoyl dehydrogenase [Candidatus Aminicenantes bacterium]